MRIALNSIKSLRRIFRIRRERFGILSSTDILALDQACVDLIYARTEAEHHDLVERIESRHGLRQLSYMKEPGMGNDSYILIDLDNGVKRIAAAEAVGGLKPFVKK